MLKLKKKFNQVLILFIIFFNYKTLIKFNYVLLFLRYIIDYGA